MKDKNTKKTDPTQVYILACRGGSLSKPSFLSIVTILVNGVKQKSLLFVTIETQELRQAETVVLSLEQAKALMPLYPDSMLVEAGTLG